VPLYVGQSKPRCYGGGRGIATSIKGKNRKVTLVTVAVGAEMFAGMSGVVMASRRHTCCWLGVRSGARTTVWIYVDMKTMIPGGSPLSCGDISKPLSLSDSLSVPISLPTNTKEVARTLWEMANECRNRAMATDSG
jgi:hypothetical protein